jgi:signal transduction histidine kinase
MISTSQKIRKINVLDRLKMGIHDIRSPITFLRILETYATNLSPHEKNLLEIATRRIVGVVDSMDKLLHSNGVNNKYVDKTEPINLSTTIERILIEKRYEYKHLNIVFKYTPPEYTHKCLIYCEINDFERMLSNLINNAVEACNKNGIVRISLELKNKILYLSIIDNGKGISPEVLHKLRNGISVTYGKENGHGVGFKQIRDVITQLGGSLTINSTLDFGTEVQLILSVATSN